MSPILRKPKSAWIVLIGLVACVGALGQHAPQNPPPDPHAAKPPADQPGKAPPPAGDPKAAPVPTTNPALRTPPQVSSEDLLKEFQKDRPRAVPIMPSGSPDEEVVERDAPTFAGGRRMPDGFFLVDRVGRLTREGEWWVFTFEGYNETHPEPPMKLLPNQLLERMVIESEGASSSTVFVVSGEVTEFKNENFLLLRKLLHRRNLGNLEK